jgi:mRNA-degrading endonuclease HigB of HigAB toxin-antitoxin module
VYDEALPQG